MNDLKILPVILAGGSGERLWPLSRSQQPKQFLDPLNTQQTLFQATIQRLPQNAKLLAPLILCNLEHRFIVAEQLRNLKIANATIILEPCSKNTAPAIALATTWAQKNYKDAVLLVLAADHHISDLSNFHESISKARQLADKDYLVTFGINITRPETGYGYIECQENDKNKVKRFIEKPDITKAKEYAINPSYYWNSGMFMFKASVLENELLKFCPEILNSAKQSLELQQNDLDFIRIDSKIYGQAPNISIDYAVMEHTDNAAVIPLNSAWSDIGSWQAIWQNGNKDNNNNCINGDAITINTNNCLIKAEQRLIASLNVSNLAIIETSDAILVADLAASQEVKQILTKLRDINHSSATYHKKTLRPWGWFESLSIGTNFQVKKIFVSPKQSLSLQLHRHRSEHWIVISGTATVTKGNETFELSTNQSTFIPVGTKHKLTNNTEKQLTIIEVQSGDYLGEDDIIRLSDEYGRTTTKA